MDENELDGQKEPINEDPNSDVAAASAAQSRNSESDTTNKTPPQPRSSDAVMRAAQTETPYRCIRECLENAYDIITIKAFCTSYFYTSVHKRIAASHGLDEIIIMIIDHCEQHGETESFWQALQQDRPHWYSKYYSRWQKAIERASKIDRLDTSEYAFKPDTRNERVESTEHNPLDKSSDELTRWFFKELRQDERSLLLTAALFEGLSRQKMLQVANLLEEVLSE